MLQKEFAFNSAYGDQVFRFCVAKISVGVFGMVTPQMVAALGTASVRVWTAKCYMLATSYKTATGRFG